MIAGRDSVFQPCVSSTNPHWLTFKSFLLSNEEPSRNHILAQFGLVPGSSWKRQGYETKRAATSLRPSLLFPHHFTSRASHLEDYHDTYFPVHITLVRRGRYAWECKVQYSSQRSVPRSTCPLVLSKSLLAFPTTLIPSCDNPHHADRPSRSRALPAALQGRQ